MDDFGVRADPGFLRRLSSVEQLPGGPKGVQEGRAMGLERGLAYALGRSERPATEKVERRPLDLTKRQFAVARLVAQGLTNKEIARDLWISERTAEGHVEQIRNKLGVSTRSQVASWYTREIGGEVD
jgi:DNA-binding NarL/FixJ family response regulator